MIKKKIVITGAIAFLGAATVSPISLAETHSSASSLKNTPAFSLLDLAKEKNASKGSSKSATKFSSIQLAQQSSKLSQSRFKPSHRVKKKKRKRRRKSKTTSTQQPRQQFVSAAPTKSKKVTATSDSTMQPSTSSTTPPANLSSALGLGPSSRIHINGFLTAGIAWSDTSSKYLFPNYGTVDNHVSAAPLSLIGLQFTADLAHNLQVITQLVGDGDNTNGNVAYRVNVEWAFLRYAFSDNYQVQVGRIRLPAFLYSQTQQVGYSYPWVFLPNEVYRIVPFENLNGISFITRTPLGGSGWNITVQTYYGNNQSKYTVYNVAFPDGFDVNFDEDAIAGIVATIGNENFTLRGTYATLKLTGYFPGISPIIPSTTLFTSNSTEFYSVGAKMSFWHIILIGEYANRETPSTIAALEGYYASLGFKIGKLVPLFTYGYIDTTNANSLAQAPGLSERPQDQQSYTLSLDYTLNSNLDVKGSVSQISPLHGTFGLFNSNPGRRQVYLYGLSLNAIF